MGVIRLEPLLPFTEEEYAEIIVLPEQIVSSPRKSVGDISDWQAKKATYGMIRLDLTIDLPKTVEGFPIVDAYKGPFPTDLVDIGKIGKCTSPGAWSNGFSDDYILDRIYRQPAKYFNKIPQGGGFMAPDFSVKLQMSEIEKKFNIARRNTLAALAQKYGIASMVPLTWAEYATLEYCCNGITPEGIYAISNIGIRNDFISRKLFMVGLMEVTRILNPMGYVLYGYPMDNTCGVKTIVYPNTNYTLRNFKGR